MCLAWTHFLDVWCPRMGSRTAELSVSRVQILLGQEVSVADPNTKRGLLTDRGEIGLRVGKHQQKEALFVENGDPL